MSDKEVLTISLEKGRKFPYTFQNPLGSLVKCTVLQGKGKVVLMEDGKKVAGPYSLSLDPGKAYFVLLNTARSPYYSGKYEVVIEGMGSKNQENNFLLEVPLGKISSSDRKYITERKSRKRPVKKQ
jgi:hypothetical protein